MFEDMSKQFEKPSGFLGKIAGSIMFFENKKINKWTIQQLNIHVNDHLLEVGYGPGYAIQYVMKNFPKVSIDGIDISEKMKHEAEKRNEEWIEQGKVKLFCNDISDLEVEPERYDKVFSVNNYPLWKDPIISLQHLYKFLKFNGKIALTVQPHEEGATDDTTRQLGEQMKEDLLRVGFKNIEISFKDVRPILTVCVTGLKE